MEIKEFEESVIGIMAKVSEIQDAEKELRENGLVDVAEFFDSDFILNLALFKLIVLSCRFFDIETKDDNVTFPSFSISELKTQIDFAK